MAEAGAVCGGVTVYVREVAITHIVCCSDTRLRSSVRGDFVVPRHSFSLHLFVSQKSLNDEEGDNCLLVLERSYGPGSQSIFIHGCFRD